MKPTPSSSDPFASVIGARRPKDVIWMALVALSLMTMYHLNHSINSSNNCVWTPAPSGLPEVLKSKKQTSTSTTRTNDDDDKTYHPAMVEQYVYEHRDELGYNTQGNEMSSSCEIWNNASKTTIHKELHTYHDEMVKYWEAVKQYSWVKDQGITDIRQHLQNPNDTSICDHLQVDPQGRDLLQAFFPKSQQLSYTSTAGWVEPLLPPMRHPRFCWNPERDPQLNIPVDLMNVEYLVHDFAAMCRKLKPTSKLVLFDLGASPHFSGEVSPWVKILRLFYQFGFAFDHIYAYEINPFAIEKVYELVPKHMHAAYHWINAGVSAEPGHNLNPFTLLEENFGPDDMVIFKLDIDHTPIEMPLAHRLLNSTKLQGLIDQFYFEHHIQTNEMWDYWRGTWSGSMKDTLDLFYGLRQGGVPAHFWV